MSEIPTKDPYEPYRIKEPFDKTKVPEPIFDENPNFIDLYYIAWKSAWGHVVKRDDMPEKLYLDEAMTPHVIWVWDTCFMTLFCKYAFDYFPGIQSLNNFYYIIHDRKKSGAKIHFSDNPPLFAWVESEYFNFTGDLNRLRWVLEDRKYLQKHFDFMELTRGWRKPLNVLVSKCSRKYDIGYKWRGNTSGMDNTPRGRNWWNNTKLNQRGQIFNNNIYFLDLLAQQALAANCISELSKHIKNDEITLKYKNIFEEKKQLSNEYYWNSQDSIYYDLFRKNKATIDKMKQKGLEIHNKVPTIASYWPLLAGIADESQANSMNLKAIDENWFGGKIPYPSLARVDPEYRPTGRYWRGGVWLPTAYMATKALEKYGFYKTANDNAKNLVAMMDETYRNYEPNTIWECYSPSKPEPSTQKRDQVGGVRPDFCGWSALGPISMLIENIIGINKASAVNKTVEWLIHHKSKHGIKQLKFGNVVTDLIYEDSQISIKSNMEYVLKIIDSEGKTIKEINVKPGSMKESLDIKV
jgi:hypothetical protein